MCYKTMYCPSHSLFGHLLLDNLSLNVYLLPFITLMGQGGWYAPPPFYVFLVKSGKISFILIFTIQMTNRNDEKAYMLWFENGRSRGSIPQTACQRCSEPLRKPLGYPNATFLFIILNIIFQPKTAQTIQSLLPTRTRVPSIGTWKPGTKASLSISTIGKNLCYDNLNWWRSKA